MENNNNNNKILEELKEITPLLSRLENKNPYAVSFSYFDNLADKILEKIITGAEPSYFFTRKNPYSAPVGYFRNLSASIMLKVEEEASKSEIFEEMEEISPLLNTISKRNVYTAPDGYFVKAEWTKSSVPVKKSKVVSISTGKRFFNYAAAAIIGLLVTGLFLFTGKENRNATANVKAASEVKKLSEQEIVDFLKTTAPTENIIVTNNGSNKKDSDIKSIVSQMSDKEIQQFLEENGAKDEM